MRRPVFLAVLLGVLAAARVGSAQTLPVITVTTNTTTVSEPNGIAAFVIFKNSGPDVTIQFEMTGTSVLGVDYFIIGGGSSLVVLGDANVALVQIESLDNFAVEPDKTITLNVLPNPSYAISTDPIAFYPAYEPSHRWLGTDGNSSSFYIVDAAGRAWVWGDNASSQLGLGFQGGVVTRPTMLPPPAGKKWRQFTSNSYCAVGVTDDGLIYGMGENMAGSSSIFTTTDPNVPMPLPVPDYEMLIHLARLTENGLWIVDALGALRANFGPQFLSGWSIKAMQTGGVHVVAIDDPGYLYYGPPEIGNLALDTSKSGANSRGRVPQPARRIH